MTPEQSRGDSFWNRFVRAWRELWMSDAESRSYHIPEQKYQRLIVAGDAASEALQKEFEDLTRESSND